jgi:hypothetical protein
MTGQKYNQEEVLLAFGHKLVFIEEDKVFIPSFINFQYGDKPGNSKMHKSIERKLESLGLEWGKDAKPQTTTIIEEVTTEEVASRGRAEELLRRAQESKTQVQAVRRAYPLNNGGDPANKAIAKAIKDHGYDAVLNGAKLYAEKTKGTEPKFIKSTARFFTEEVFLDFQGEQNLWDADSKEYKLSHFFYLGVKNWTAGIMATEAEIQAGCIHFEEMLKRDDVDENMIVGLIRWIDKFTDRKSGFSWRTNVRTAQNLKERFLKNEFHEFTKSYHN